MKIAQLPQSPPNHQPPPPPPSGKKFFIFGNNLKQETEPITENSGGILQIHQSVDQSAQEINTMHHTRKDKELLTQSLDSFVANPLNSPRENNHMRVESIEIP